MPTISTRPYIIWHETLAISKSSSQYNLVCLSQIPSLFACSWSFLRSLWVSKAQPSLDAKVFPTQCHAPVTAREALFKSQSKRDAIVA